MLRNTLIALIFIAGFSGVVSAAPTLQYRQEATLLPITDATYDLGTTTKRWRNVYISGTITGATIGTSLSAGTVNTDSSGTLYSTGTSTPSVTAPITYSGTLGQFIGGVSGAFGCAVATGSIDGCLSAADWTTFNAKESALTFTYPLTRSVNAISLAFGTTTDNTWSGLQAFSNTGTTTFAGSIDLTSLDGHITAHGLRSDASDGLHVHANNWTNVATFGVGNTANALFYGGVNIDGATRLATSLTGFLKATSGTVSAVSSIVPGDISLTKGNFLVGNDAGVAQATSTVFISSAGNVGIGTTNPAGKLNIVASANTQGFLFEGSEVSGQGISMFGAGPATTGIGWRATAFGSNFTLPSDNIPQVSGGVAGYTKGYAIGFGMEDSSDTGITFWSGSGTGTDLTEKIRITNAGNVGIGTTTPSAKLGIGGTGTLFELLDTAGSMVMRVVSSTVTLLGTWDFSGATVKTHEYSSFTYATSTAWTATTTIPLGPAATAESWDDVMCFTDTGTLNVSIYDGTNRMNMFNASTTVGTVDLSTNNTFTLAEKRYVDVGTPASTPTKISCTVDRIVNF